MKVRGPDDPATDGRPPFLPSRDDPAVRAASGAIGGPWGRHGAVGLPRFWAPLRVLLALTLVTLALAWLQKSPCQNGAWTAGRQYTHFCYSDVIPLYYSERLNEGAVPYADQAVEYPVLTGAFMGVSAWLARAYVRAAAGSALPDAPDVQAYFNVTALLLAISMLVVTWSTFRLAGRRRWDAAMVALSPLLVVHAYTNWDLFAVALAGSGLVAWQRRRPGLAGALLGLGVAAKLYPVLFFVPLLALCWRSRRMTAFWTAVAGAAVAWAAVNLPVAALYPDSWRRFFELNRERTADFDSLWYGLHALLVGPGGSAPQVNGIATLAVLVALCGVLGLGLVAPRRPRLPQLLFLVVAAFLLTNKVWSPQYSLWLLPLAVLARPSWRALLAWQATECLVWVPRLLWFLGTGDKGVGYNWFLGAVLVRDLALIALMALVVRDVLRPEEDVVRQPVGSVGSAGPAGPAGPAGDDPAGGVLDGAEDSGPVLAGRSNAGVDLRNAT
ncbi:MAG TPA: glycosyltransferase 87 family protein [Mycobacteriales bacterium]|nr:glycosyltransferase 87 family protein [Mycobacteriales bacterium]